MNPPVLAVAFEAPDPISNKAKAAMDIPFTGSEGEEECEAGGATGSDVDKFLQALAKQESGGDPKAQNPVSSAAGKYQYLTGTWRSRVEGAGAIYPPGNQYAVASAAPEAVQDAVVYIEYSKKFTEFNGDLVKLAVSHFYPAAISDPGQMDRLIGGNTITPREYGEAMVKKIKAGEGSDIPLKYREAPEFEKYATSDTGETATASSDCANFTGGTLSETTLAYAWPEHHAPNYLKMMPDYKKAVETAQKEGRYVGGGPNPGVDCGGFVTTLLFDSGFEPEYNSSAKGGPTPSQEAWVKSNWESLGKIDPAKLLPGDVAFTGGPSHTFVYVGKIPGFGSNIASASYSPSNTSWRTPMAGQESLSGGDIRWYRKKT